jgi:ABC-type multidrug transport system permease subunit
MLLCSEAIDSIRALSKRSNRISFSRQVSILSGRTILNLYRNPFLMISHYGVSLVMAVLVGFIFWQVEDNIAGVQNRLGCIFFSLVFFGFGSLTTLDVSVP